MTQIQMSAPVAALAAAPLVPPSPGLIDLVGRIERILLGEGDAAPQQAVAAAIADAVRDPGLLAGRALPFSAEKYQQEVLHRDPDGRYSVVAVCWLPGQVSPAHDHAAWCAFGVWQGRAREEYFQVQQLENGRTTIVQSGHRYLEAGTISFADTVGIHRVGNAGAEPMVSIHVYGLDMVAHRTSIRERYAA